MQTRAGLFFSMLSLVAALLLSGCATGPTTLKQIRMDVDWPMTRYRNAVSAGAVTLGEQQQVNQAYTNYQQALDDAVQAAHGNYETPAPANVKASANQVIDIISAIPY